jgi:hypothetical protein
MSAILNYSRSDCSFKYVVICTAFVQVQDKMNGMALDADVTAQLKCPVCLSPLPDARSNDVNSLIQKIPTAT